MPFLYKENKIDQVSLSLKEALEERPSFEITFEGIAAFRNRQIYLKVSSNEFLTKIQRDIALWMKRHFNIFNANYRDYPYHPHLTIAFRDLKKVYFDIAFQYYMDLNYEASFTVSEISMLKLMADRWETISNYQLGSLTT